MTDGNNQLNTYFTMEKKFIFKKDYKSDEGVINAGRELMVVRGAIYLDGGMLMPSYQREFMRLITDDKLRDEYLQEERIIYNKV